MCIQTVRSLPLYFAMLAIGSSCDQCSLTVKIFVTARGYVRHLFHVLCVIAGRECVIGKRTFILLLSTFIDGYVPTFGLFMGLC